MAFAVTLEIRTVGRAPKFSPGDIVTVDRADRDANKGPDQRWTSRTTLHATNVSVRVHLDGVPDELASAIRFLMAAVDTGDSATAPGRRYYAPLTDWRACIFDANGSLGYEHNMRWEPWINRGAPTQGASLVIRDRQNSDAVVSWSAFASEWGAR